MTIEERLRNAEQRLQQHVQARDFHKQQAENHNAEGLRWEGRVQALREVLTETDAAVVAPVSPSDTDHTEAAGPIAG